MNPQVYNRLVFLLEAYRVMYLRFQEAPAGLPKSRAWADLRLAWANLEAFDDHTLPPTLDSVPPPG